LLANGERDGGVWVMANASIAYDNLIDRSATTLTASGFVTSAPPTNLVDPHTRKKWRDNAATTFVIADFTSTHTVDVVMLAGVSGNPNFRVRMSSADPTGAAGDAFDSGTVSGDTVYDSNYGLFVLPVGTSARYLRVDLSQVGVAYIEAGRMFAGTMVTTETNYQTPWSRSIIRGSVDIIGVGGQTFVDLRQGYRVLDISYEFISEEERVDFLEAMGVIIANVGHLDFLWFKDFDDPNPRDALWGYLSDLRVTQNLYLVPPFYGVQFTMRERL
jgi:hypothetical protein